MSSSYGRNYVKKFPASIDSSTRNIEILHFFESLNQLEWAELLNDLATQPSYLSPLLSLRAGEDTVSHVAVFLEHLPLHTKNLIIRALDSLVTEWFARSEKPEFQDSIRVLFFVAKVLRDGIKSGLLVKIVSDETMSNDLRQDAAAVLVNLTNRVSDEFWTSLNFEACPFLAPAAITALGEAKPTVAFDILLRIRGIEQLTKADQTKIISALKFPVGAALKSLGLHAKGSKSKIEAQRTIDLLPSNLRQLVMNLPLYRDVFPPERSKQTHNRKPNILILWGDDIGVWNISHFSRGMMGYQTPNIDRVAKEGVTFTDYYSQQSCTAGRACFITGQNPIRTGLTKVGMPGATVGLQKEDPTIAELLKPLGYATGQFGKNHLGDRNEYLPTVHGFDEFFGNLYHLNAEEEPELPDYPKDPAFKAQFGPRGVLHCLATDVDDPTEEPRWGRVGKQKVTDTGPLTKKRMETVDEEITERAIGWMEKQVAADRPFFLWYNSTAMHFRTHVAEKNLGKSGQDPYSDRMVVHDEQIGQVLDKLDALGIADNTIVMYSTDNGPENDTWPDGATTPFRGQKDSNWEGGWRVPCFMRWPGKIEAGAVLNGIVSHLDMFPTLLAAAGNPDVTQQLLNGTTVGGQTYKVHLDGYNQIPYLTGEAKESPRQAIMYFSDDGDVIAVRVGDYKFHLAIQRANTMRLWAEPFEKLRLPYIMNLRRDPLERAEMNSNTYMDWMVNHVPQLYMMQAVVAAQIADFAAFPPRQKPASFNLDAVLAQVAAGAKDTKALKALAKK